MQEEKEMEGEWAYPVSGYRSRCILKINFLLIGMVFVGALFRVARVRCGAGVRRERECSICARSSGVMVFPSMNNCIERLYHAIPFFSACLVRLKTWSNEIGSSILAKCSRRSLHRLSNSTVVLLAHLDSLEINGANSWGTKSGKLGN